MLKLLIPTFIILSIITVFAVYNTPIWNNDVELYKSSFKFRGEVYTYLTMYTKAYDYELDKAILKSKTPFGRDYYSFKNDNNKDFIFVSEFGDKFIYTKAKITDNDLKNPNCEYRNIIKPKFSSSQSNQNKHHKFNPNDGFYSEISNEK